MQTIKAFEIKVNTDTTEGRGPMKTLAYFKHHIAAFDVVDDPRFKRWCVMGVHMPREARRDVHERELVIFDTAEEFWEKFDVLDKRQKALAKLTAEDRKVLGLE